MWSHKENTSRVRIWSRALPVCFSIPQLLPSPSIWLCLQQGNAYLFKAPRQLKTNHVLTAKASHSQKPFHDKAGIVIRLHREHHSNGRVESQHSGPATETTKGIKNLSRAGCALPGMPWDSVGRRRINTRAYTRCETGICVCKITMQGLCGANSNHIRPLSPFWPVRKS